MASTCCTAVRNRTIHNAPSHWDHCIRLTSKHWQSIRSSLKNVFWAGASYSPDGKQLLLTSSPEAFGGIGKNCGDHPIANDFDSQAFIMDLATRHIQPITKDFNRIGQFPAMEPGRRLHLLQYGRQGLPQHLPLLASTQNIRQAEPADRRNQCLCTFKQQPFGWQPISAKRTITAA